MFRHLYRALIAVSTLAMAAGPTTATAAEKIFLFVRDGSRDLDRMLTREVGVMRSMLEAAGFEVDVANSSGEPMVAASVTLTPDVRLEDVDLADYAGVVLPCMAPAPGHPLPARVDELVTEAVAAGKPVAASRGSVVTLAKAGGVSARHYAFAGPVDVRERPEFTGGTFMGTGVVRDDHVSTAGICPLAAHELGEPDGTAELMRSFIASLTNSG